MPDLDVSAARLRAAATGVGSVASTVAALDPSGPLSRIGSALPGATAGAAASVAGTSLAGDLHGWAAALRVQADALRSAASTFHATDHESSAALRSAGRAHPLDPQW